MPTQLSNSTLTTLQTTYLDDFSETKNFHRILFRPAVAVQARELTQIQTILQNQVQRLGDFVFKDGSIVDGCAITYHSKLPLVRVRDANTSNGSFTVTDYDSSYIITNSTNSNNAVRASILYSTRGFEANYPDTNRFYIKYYRTGKSGANTDVNEFANGDTLYIYNSVQNNFANLDSNNLINTINVYVSNSSTNSTGYGYGLTVSDGIIYQKGFFIRVDQPQTIIVRDYDQSVNNIVVGFETAESIVTENQDTSLNDNANGSSNYNAPGAHRLKLTPVLTSKLRSTASNNFFAIAEFENNNVVTEQKNSNDPTGKILDFIAGRTYDESGDYVVRPFQVDSRASSSSNSSTFDYMIHPGLAYVRGYQVEKIGMIPLETERASTSEIDQNQNITANYGNYVIVDEALGNWGVESLAQVTLYDTAQNSISDRENSSSAPSGTIIGYANVRAFVYYSGTRGLADCQYLLYLTNIRMNSGYSFSQVKGIYAGSTAGVGFAKADPVLENSVAVLKESKKNFLLFDTGKTGLKTLYVNSAAATDTSFTFRQTSFQTLANTGLVTFNLDAAGPGGTEELAYSVGNYSSATVLSDFIISANSATYSTNRSGTITVTSGSNTVTGSGSAFTTQLFVGELIRVGNATASPVYFRISAIANNTQMSIYETPGATYTANVYQQYFPEGHIFNISAINVLSGAISFTANVGDVLGTSSIVVNGSYPVTRTLAVETSKDVKKNTVVKIDCSNNAANSVGPWDLGLVDVYKIENIYVGTTYANTNPDQKNWFILDSGQRDDRYEHSRLFVRPEYASNITGSSKLLIKLNHFVANTSAGVGIFTVDSYPVDDANTSNTTAIQTAEIPVYNSTIGRIDLRNYIDARPWHYNTATVTTTEGSATINPAANTTFNPGTNQYTPAPDSTITTDLEYYLPRYDVIVVNKEGDMLVKQGVPSTNPRIPFVDSDVMTIAESYVHPYPSLSVQEGESFARKDIANRIAIKTTKRYTMKDIRALDDRLRRVEYYVVLNALEQRAKDLNVPSAANPTLNRFKNGIFADPFNSHDNGNVTDFEYKIAVDSLNTVMRPYFDTHNIDFKYDSANSTTTRTGSLVTVPYTHINYIRQPFATKFRNCTESIWEYNGKLELFPTFDYYVDTKQANNININIDTGAAWQEFANSPFGTNYGDWRTVREQTTQQASGNQLTNITETTLERTVTSIQVNTTSEQYEFGNYVKDFSIQPYIRSRLVAFVAKNLKPNTTVYPFFDDINVSVHCAPGILSGSTSFHQGKENEVVSQKGNFGGALVTNADGQIFGIFRIPEGTFRVGDRVFRLANVNDLVTGADAIITSGTATYSASSVSVTRQSTTLNVTQPSLSFSSNTVSNTVVSTDVVAIVGGGGGNLNNEGGQGDPIAQTFKISTPEGGESGLFVTKVGVYFQAKDSNANNGITMYISEVRNGYPDTSQIVGRARKESSEVTVSATAAVETQFVLDQPVMLTSNKDYAFILYPDGNSPEWYVWTGEVGGTDVATGENVFSSPYIAGVMFISSNFSTWTAVQKEDIKFNLYRANFSTGTYYSYFHNENDEYLTTASFTRANSSVAIEVGDVVYTANSTGGPNTAANAAFGIVQFIDEADGTLYLDSSTNGKFIAGNNINVYRVSDPSNTSLVTSNTLIAQSSITAANNLMYHAVVPKFAKIEPIRTSVSYSFQGTDASYNKDGTYKDVVGELEVEYFDKSRYAVSKSNEITNMSGIKSSTFRIALDTSSPYVSPAISLTRKASLFIENIINNDSTDEHTRYGNALAKYVSKTVVLADGQEAEDLRVLLTAYRPVNSDIIIYAKFWNETDGETFESKVWTELDYLNSSDLVFSDPTNRDNTFEYEFGVPATPPVTRGAFLNASDNDILYYEDTAGGDYRGFKRFAIKIVLLSSDPVRVPVLHDVRAIALQV